MKKFLVLIVVVGRAQADRSSSKTPPVVAPFGATRVAKLLNPFSGHLPPSAPPAFAWPPIDTVWRVKPRLRITKHFYLTRGMLRHHGSVTCTMRHDGSAQLDAKVQEPLFGGDVCLDGGASIVTWCKLWLFPGLTDSATRVELRSAFDLRTGKGHSEVKLGLRGLRREQGLKNSLRLVHRQSVNGGDVLNVDAGALLTLPDELRVSTDGTGGLRKLASKALVEIEVDQLDVCIDLE